MPAAVLSDEEFAELFEKIGGTAMARELGMDFRWLMKRRRAIESRVGRTLVSPFKNIQAQSDFPHRLEFDIENGIVPIASDAHYWPGVVTTAHRAFVKFVKEYQPPLVIMNGDALDGARISRFSPIGWENRPELVNELEACKDRMGEIVTASPKSRRAWPLGNHDGRFETKLAQMVPEYARIHGFHLKDHLPEWSPCWSVWISDSVVVKHRYKGGIHATHNNALWAGKNIVTGHDHMLKVTPLADYNGTRWGVSTGTLAEPYGPQFVDYTEDSPKNWESGFQVLTFEGGRLLWPETVYVIDSDHVGFRGKVHRV